MSRPFMATTAIISPSPASRDWHGRCAPLSKSILPRRTAFPRPRERSRPMPLWTVHSKVEEPDAIRARAGDVRFVREGFNWPAFLVPLVWLVIKGMWIVLLIALAVEMAIIALGASLKLSDLVVTILGLGINFVMGFAGNDLYRWTLMRAGFREVALAAGV